MNQPEALWQHAMQAINQGKLKIAVAALKELDSQTIDANVHSALAQCYWQMGRYSSSRDYFKLAWQTSSGEWEHGARYIKALTSLGEKQRALEIISAQHQRYPNQEWLHLFQLVHDWPVQQEHPSYQFLKKLISMGRASTEALFFFAAHAALSGDSELAQSCFASLPHDEYREARIDGIKALSKRQAKIPQYGSAPEMLSAAAIKAGINTQNKQRLWLEFGVYFGRSLRQLATQFPEQKLFGFDSFEGLPENWKAGESAGSYSTGNVLPDMPANVKLIKGWFKDTIPNFLQQHQGDVALLHIDCDLYSSTSEVLKNLGERIKRGTIIVFDDFVCYPGFENHEIKAFDEFLEQTGHSCEYIGYALMGREVAVRIV